MDTITANAASAGLLESFKRLLRGHFYEVQILREVFHGARCGIGSKTNRQVTARQSRKLSARA